jgi:uncharacterized protein DUF6196
MVQVSVETPEATEQRLLKVIAAAELRVFSGAYLFEEFPLNEFRIKANPNAFALVRDDRMWSQLVPADGREGETFALFSFHFPKIADNSGFVGWLASALKRRLGTGVFVTCGQNSGWGGIFDYWGCPLALRDLAIAVIEELRAEGRRLAAGEAS